VEKTARDQERSAPPSAVSPHCSTPEPSGAGKRPRASPSGDPASFAPLHDQRAVRSRPNETTDSFAHAPGRVEAVQQPASAKRANSGTALASNVLALQALSRRSPPRTRSIAILTPPPAPAVKAKSPPARSAAAKQAARPAAARGALLAVDGPGHALLSLAADADLDDAVAAAFVARAAAPPPPCAAIASATAAGLRAPALSVADIMSRSTRSLCEGANAAITQSVLRARHALSDEEQFAEQGRERPRLQRSLSLVTPVCNAIWSAWLPAARSSFV